MGTKGEELATQFEQANADMIAAVEGMSEEQWRADCPSDGRSIAVMAHHVATSHAGISGLVAAVANGQPVPPFTRELIDQGNAEHAREHADATREETLALLRENGAAAAAIVRPLSDDQLARTATLLGNEATAAGIAETILIGHPRTHLASIQAAMQSA